MSLRKLLAVRFAVLLILIAASVIIINFTTFIEEAQRMGYTVLSLAVIVAMGAASTYMSLSKMKPETMTNGGVPERSDPEQTPIQTTSDEVEENMRKMLQQNPDIIPPQKTDLAPRNPQTVNNEGKQVILDKIVDALRNADVKVSVDGTVDTE
jgi:glucan phosphoethanolaminetransferase (alkaline phosphatase superfamily)